MSEELIQRPTTTAETEAARFTAMAERIRLNAEQSFGGAILIAPPRNGGEAIEVLILDTGQSPALFWSTVKTKAEMALSELESQSRNQSAFGLQRR